MSYLTHTLLGCVLLGASLPAAAQTTSITTCPFDITAPGVYHVTQDLFCPGNGITINADNVELHLDGHILDGTGVGEIGIGVYGSNDSVLGSGTVTNFYYDDIQVQGSGNRLVNLTATSAVLGIDLYSSTQTTVLNCTANNNIDGIVIEIGSSQNTLISNTASGNEFDGIGLYAVSNNILRANQTDGNYLHGIYVSEGSSSNLLQANKAHGNTVFDLEDDNTACDANTWKSNSFDTANQPCIN
ncbi:MAG TPA: right-handed parallel beta-helix repeat-containing protein [Bryobacteraceae bacterium]|jgi:parallel beta-helix repeat protein|nr:right-handed parallel beta-helix repeat-containing protein [Bryobacteraceae bacterium]